MSAFVIIDMTPKTPDSLKQYAAAAPATLTKYGGEVLVKGAIEALHGDAPLTTKVVIQFPDRQSAADWYHSPEYQQLIPIRNQGMESRFHLVG